MTTCPHCNRPIEGAHAHPLDEHATPQPGDFSVCVYCTGFVVFLNDMGVRKLEPTEFDHLNAEAKAELESTRKTVRRIQRAFGWERH